MFFNIDADTGQTISGWIAPDNPSLTPSILIRTPGREDLTLQANVERADIREMGLHTSGRVGFMINNSIIPDLENLAEIEVFYAETGILLHRRFQPSQHIEKKLFLFDASVMPQRKILHYIKTKFSLNYPNCEQFPLETMIVLINNHFSNSIFFSGRPNFNRYASFLENSGYLRAALLRDPFEELAERLIFLKVLYKKDMIQLMSPHLSGLTPLIDFAAELQFEDRKALVSAFRHASEAHRTAMTSPMVRMLGCNLDEMPTHSDVSLALDHLASLDLVGTRKYYRSFRATLNQLLGAEALCDTEPGDISAIQDLARNLRQVGVSVDLLEHDAALYSYVEEAIVAGAQRQNGLVARDTQSN